MSTSTVYSLKNSAGKVVTYLASLPTATFGLLGISYWNQYLRFGCYYVWIGGTLYAYDAIDGGHPQSWLSGSYVGRAYPPNRAGYSYVYRGNPGSSGYASSKTVTLGTVLYDANQNAYTISTSTRYQYILGITIPDVNEESVAYIYSVDGSATGNTTTTVASYSWVLYEKATRDVNASIRAAISTALPREEWLGKYYLDTVTQETVYSASTSTIDVTNSVSLVDDETNLAYSIDVTLDGLAKKSTLTFNFVEYVTQTLYVDIYKATNADGDYVNAMEVSGIEGVDNGTYVRYAVTYTTKGSTDYEVVITPTEDALGSESDIFYINNASSTNNNTGADSTSFDDTTKSLTVSGSFSSLSKTVSITFGKYANVTATVDVGVASYSMEATEVEDEEMTLRSAITSGEYLRLPPLSGYYTITATTEAEYLFTTSTGVSSMAPSANCHSYTTTSRVTPSGDMAYTITAQQYTIGVDFRNSEHSAYGTLSILNSDGDFVADAVPLYDRTYEFKFTPVDESENPYGFMVSQWGISNGTNISTASSGGTTFTEESIYEYAPELTSINQNLTAYATLEQRRWDVSVTTSEGGNVTVYIKSKEDDTTLATYTNSVGRPIDPVNEYLVFVPTALENYKFDDFSDYAGTLEEYEGYEGDGYAFDMPYSGTQSILGDATISVNFVRSNFHLIITSTDPNVCTTKIIATTEDGATGASNGYYSKETYGSSSNNPLIFYAIVAGDADTAKYSITAFKIYYGASITRDEDGNIANDLYTTLSNPDYQPGTNQLTYFYEWYYKETGYHDYVVEAVVQPLTFDFKLVVKSGEFTTVDGEEVFVESSKTWGYVETTIGTETQTEVDAFEREIREDTDIKISCGTYYGGRCVRIVAESSSGTTTKYGDTMFEYDMPLSDATITVYFSERTTYEATLNSLVWNDSLKNTVYAGTITIVSSRYPNSFTETTTHTAAGETTSFSLYLDEEYYVTYTTSGSDFDRRYFFSCWGWLYNSDFGDSALTELNTYYDSDTYVFTNSDEEQTSLRLSAIFSKRETASVIISYAIRSIDDEGNETITEVSEDDLETTLPGCSLTLADSEYYDETTGQYFTGSDVVIGCTITGSMFEYEEEGLETTSIKVVRPTYILYGVGSEVYSTLGAWDSGLTHDSEFKMTGTIYLRAVYSVSIERGMTIVNLKYYGQGTSAMGSMAAFATSMGEYLETDDGYQVLVTAGNRVTIMASVAPSYYFAGWYTATDDGYSIVDTAAVYEIDGTYVGAGGITYYASFLPSLSAQLLMWNGGDETKTFTWRSKIYVGASFYSVNSIMVYSDNYPVTVTVYASSSPRDLWTQTNNRISFTLNSQHAQRVPYMKPEKYFGFKVEGSARINYVAIASSMEALK